MEILQPPRADLHYGKAVVDLSLLPDADPSASLESCGSRVID